MNREDKRNVIIGITVITVMLGVAWTVYHYNMQQYYAEVRCNEVAKEHGTHTDAYKQCIAHQKSMFSEKKSEEARKKVSE